MGGGGRTEGTQNFFQKGCGLGGGRKARCYLQAGSRVATGLASCWKFFLSLRLWNCFCSQPEQRVEGADQRAGPGAGGPILNWGLGERSPWVERRWPCVCPGAVLSPPICSVGTLPVSSPLGLTCSWEDSSCPAKI